MGPSFKVNHPRDWIDQVFYDLEGRAVNEAVRFRLLDLVETAGLEDMEEADIIMSIEADELTRHEADELWRRLLDAQPRVPDMYAPSQTMLAEYGGFRHEKTRTGEGAGLLQL